MPSSARTARRPAVLLCLLALTACASPPPVADASADAPEAASDAPAPDAPPSDAALDSPIDSALDAGPDAAMARTGEPCASPTECGGGGPWECYAGVAGGLCTHTCVDNPSRAIQQARCGGAGTTCVTTGEGSTASSYCERACDPTAGATSCRAGFVCTGWWYTHTGGIPDDPGCWTLCSVDAHCPAGMRCNARTGTCGAATVNMALRPDGEPCNPMNVTGMPAQSTECRGACFSGFSMDATQGICGSVLNRAVSAACPDGLAAVVPEGPATDNLGLCLRRTCVDNCGCTAPLLCLTRADGNACGYGAPGDTGIACALADAGADAPGG